MNALVPPFRHGPVKFVFTHKTATSRCVKSVDVIQGKHREGISFFQLIPPRNKWQQSSLCLGLRDVRLQRSLSCSFATDEAKEKKKRKLHQALLPGLFSSHLLSFQPGSVIGCITETRWKDSDLINFNSAGCLILVNCWIEDKLLNACVPVGSARVYIEDKLFVLKCTMKTVENPRLFYLQPYFLVR